MALFQLTAGRHYHDRPPLSVLPWVGQRAIERYVTFDERCAYDSAPYNGQDVNKLFGLSFGLGGVHQDSARFGFRWSNGDQCVELLGYVYDAGRRNWDEQLRFPLVAQVARQQRRKLRIEYNPVKRVHEFTVAANFGLVGYCEVPVTTTLPHYGITHGLYFGGERTTPHPMGVRIDRV